MLDISESNILLSAHLQRAHLKEKWKKWDASRQDIPSGCAPTDVNRPSPRRVRRGLNNELSSYLPADVSTQGVTRHSVRFRGGQDSLVLDDGVSVHLPNNNFTVELWIKPEGGQHEHVVILGKFGIWSFSFRVI